ALGDELLDDGPADAAGAAGDERDFAGEPLHVASGVILYGSMARRFLGITLLIASAACGGSTTPEKAATPTPPKKAMASSAAFGQLPNGGPPITIYTLTNANGMEVRTIPYGGILVSIRVPDRKGQLDDVVLGFDGIDGYAGTHPYFGAIVGRYG